MAEDAALARLRDILARPEYHVDLDPPWWQQVLQPVWDVLVYVLVHLAQTAADAATGREGWIGLVVLAACTTLVGVVVFYLVRAVRLSVARAEQRRSASVSVRRERSDRLWRSAHQLAAAGDLAEAVRALYLSALYALDERALLRVERSLTNREHARELRRMHPDLAAAFADVVDRYDGVRYGRGPVTPQSFAELSGLVERSRDTALAGAP